MRPAQAYNLQGLVSLRTTSLSAPHLRRDRPPAPALGVNHATFDDPGLAKVVEDYLKQAGVVVTVTQNGREATLAWMSYNKA